MKVKATYVSVWDGEETITSSCDFDTETNLASDIEQVDVEELDLCTLYREYIILPSCGEIDTFDTDEGRRIVDGECIDE